jgi:uncharacterized protein YhfF
MSDNARIAAYWNAYRTAQPAPDQLPADPPEAWHFCDNEADANELGALVLAGIKTATCSQLREYEAEGEKIPAVGDLSIIIDWDGNPLGIIETTEITIRPYNEVDASFAYDEGEGDRSLAYWRAAHWRFFAREGAEMGWEPAEDMPLVCERFRLIYQK